MQLLEALAVKARLQDKIAAMFAGEHINSTEDRAVLHVALRAPRDAVCCHPQGAFLGQVLVVFWEWHTTFCKARFQKDEVELQGCPCQRCITTIIATTHLCSVKEGPPGADFGEGGKRVALTV